MRGGFRPRHRQTHVLLCHLYLQQRETRWSGLVPRLILDTWILGLPRSWYFYVFLHAGKSRVIPTRTNMIVSVPCVSLDAGSV
jgi:hypothetical protein